MVWFTFTFLLGIVNGDEEKREEKWRKKEEDKFEGEKNYTETEVFKANFLCHIEYVLFPNEPAKSIDVVAWDRAAKIYSGNSTSAIVPVVAGQLRWIHFRVNHKIKFKTEDVQAFLSHKVKFTVTLGGKNLGEIAKSDKTKKFYGPKFPDDEEKYFIRKQFFQPLSETLEDLESVSFFKEHLTPHQQLYVSLDTTLETCENRNALLKAMVDLNNEYHDERGAKVPTPAFQEHPPLINISKKASVDESDPKKRKKEKTTEAKQREPSVRKIEFCITGEEFLSGRKTFRRCLKYNSEDLPYLFALASVKNLLSKAQVEFFNPLSVMLSHFDCLPAEQLAANGVTQIKFQYLISDRFLAETNPIPVSSRSRLNYTRTVLTNSMDKNRLMQFIQTEGLKIKILGNFSRGENRIERRLYAKGLAKSRRDSRKRAEYLEKRKDCDFVLLATVSLDISSILCQPFKVRMKCHSNGVREEETGLFGPDKGEDDFCHGGKGKFHFCDPDFSSFELTIAAGLGYRLTTPPQQNGPNSAIYNRLFGVLYDGNLAVPIIEIIQQEVREFLEPIEHFKNDVNLRRPSTEKNPSGCPKPKDITGFLVDCIDKILIYVEGSTLGGIQQIWALTSSLTPHQGHVLYDSSLKFYDRLYKSFFKFGGFFTVTFKEVSQTILCQSEKYGKKNLSASAWEALKHLNLLVNCKSIKIAILNNLFPRPDCLRSLAEECGIPVQIYEKIESQIN